VRRETLIVGEPLTAEALARRIDPDPRHETFILVRHRGQTSFEPLEGDLVAGDEVVFYEFDRENEADLQAMNAGFTPAFYTAALNPAWPDELRLIADAIPASGARVLEVCCGAGRLAGSLVRDGNRVAALDASVACVAYARAQDPTVAWLAGDALALPFRDQAFDVACIFENSLGVLFSGKARALEELVRVARARVVLGLREAGESPRVHTYWSGSGFMEAAETFTPESAMALVDGLSAGVRARIASRGHVTGDPRPWGGCAFFVLLELANESAVLTAPT
jgi:SAM-dependent methyltransferase